MMPINTPFGFASTATEVIVGVDLHDRRAIVTGGASGIGVETARPLAIAGAAVTLAVRNTHAAELVAAEMIATTGSPRVHVEPLDLADQQSIAAFVDRWREPLQLFMINTGVMAVPEERTRDGSEMQFATNPLGHFAPGSVPRLCGYEVVIGTIPPIPAPC